MAHHRLEDHVEAAIGWLEGVTLGLPPGRAAACLWAWHRWLDAHDTSFTRLRSWGALLAQLAAWDEPLPRAIASPEGWAEALSEAQQEALTAWLEGQQVPVAPLFERLREGPPWVQLAMAKLLSHHAEWSHQAPEALAWSRGWGQWWSSVSPEALALRDEQGVGLVGHLMHWWRAGGAAVLPDMLAFAEAELGQGRPLGDWWGLSLGLKAPLRKRLREAMAKAWAEAVATGRLQAVDLGWLEASENAAFWEKRLNWPLEPFRTWLLEHPRVLAQALLTQAPFEPQAAWAAEAWLPPEARAGWQEALWAEGLAQLQAWWAEPLGEGWWRVHPQWPWQIVRRGLQARLLGAQEAAPLGPWLAGLKAQAEADPEAYLARVAGPRRGEPAWQAQHEAWLARGWPAG